MRLGVWFECVYHIGEFHAVADEKYGDVVANHIKIAFPGVELDSKPTRISECFWTTTFVNDCRETSNEGGLDTGGSEEISACEMRDVVGDFEEALGRSTTCVDDAFWDAFTIKIGEFLDELVVFEENGACWVTWMDGPQAGEFNERIRYFRIERRVE